MAGQRGGNTVKQRLSAQLLPETWCTFSSSFVSTTFTRNMTHILVIITIIIIIIIIIVSKTFSRNMMHINIIITKLLSKAPLEISNFKVNILKMFLKSFHKGNLCWAQCLILQVFICERELLVGWGGGGGRQMRKRLWESKCFECSVNALQQLVNHDKSYNAIQISDSL